MNRDFFPQRIICLTEEPTETLYLLGEQHRIVGVSAHTLRPPQARKEKPVVTAFIKGNLQKILSLKPDLIIGFSDIQAPLAAELIQHGQNVWISNHRSVDEIFSYIVMLGSLVGCGEKALALAESFNTQMQVASQENLQHPLKPKIYFEEWFDPLISGIRWVSELIERAGGQDIFPEFREAALAKQRIIADPSEVVRRNPDIIIASWCGKKFNKQVLLHREGWSEINAVKNGFVFEIKSELILQPGPAALTDGFKALCSIIRQWHDAAAIP
ncbi:MAG: cobalamin-binding protein [Chitinophagaceae bacterium]|nr:cobalamin-binding protein [Chitinophagaceae bacterium]